MTQKHIKQLAVISYTNNQLDEKKVTRIAGLLDRKSLKGYIRAIRLLEKKNNIVIALANTTVYNKGEFKKIFAGKTIELVENPRLLLGMQIIQNDMVYDMNVQHRLQSEVLHIKQQYE